jgi:hypothetical protein
MHLYSLRRLYEKKISDAEDGGIKFPRNINTLHGVENQKIVI